MKTSSLDSALIAQVKERVRVALAALDAREQAAAQAQAAPLGLEWREPLQGTRTRLASLQTQARTAAGKLNDLDTSLAAAERELRAFLSAAAETRQKLAAWTARAIG